MKLVKTLLLLVPLFIAHSLFAATDYNSSRSNKSYSAFVEDDTKILIQKVSADSTAVSKSMIAVDKRDDYDGEYLITVSIQVSLQRCIEVKGKKESVCTDVP